MPRETALLFIIILSLVAPSIGLGSTKIKTTQRIIVIDPGHGGTESGLISASGVEEKVVVLTLCEKIFQRLETRYNVLLTRTSDVNTSHFERIFVANRNNADLFLSIHLHCSNSESAFFYYYSLPESAMPSSSMIDNAWKSQPLIHQPESKKASDSFLSIFSTNKKIGTSLQIGAPVLLLEGATLPAILIEPLSVATLPQNPDELGTILDAYALLISKSIDLYFKKN